MSGNAEDYIIIQKIIHKYKYSVIAKSVRKQTINFFKAYMNYRDMINSLRNTIHIRHANFPSEISELMACSAIWKYKNIPSKYNSKHSGDLITHNLDKIEVKCFSSNGPHHLVQQNRGVISV
jgi:hypothetical protein